MDVYLLKVVKDTTEYIENHILDELNLDIISKNVNVSKFHLLRVWKGVTRLGLMEYVRKRRIALSLKDLIQQKMSIDYISTKYSFGCQRSYNRIFKEEYHITPTSWRKNPSKLDILEPFNAEFINVAGSGLVFFHSMTFLPKFMIAGPEYKVYHEDNIKNQTATKQGVDFYYNHRMKIINPVNPDVYIGFTSVKPNIKEYTYYQPSIEVNQNSIISEEMKTKEVPPHTYAVFRYVGQHKPEEVSSKTLVDVWSFIFHKWMPTAQFNLNDVFSFELIDYSKCSRDYSQCDLYFPISIM